MTWTTRMERTLRIVWMAASSNYDAFNPPKTLNPGPFFADNAALIAKTQQALQRITCCIADTSRLMIIQISLRKFEVFHQPSPMTNTNHPKSPLVMLNWNQHSTSHIWPASSHTIQGSTRKITTVFQRQIVLLADYTNTHGATKFCWKWIRSVSIKLSV